MPAFFRIAILGLTLFLPGMLGGCSGAGNTVIDYEPEVDFGKFKTFAWKNPDPAQAKEGEPAELVQNLMDQRLRAVTEKILSEREMEIRPPDEADLLIRGRVISRREQRVETVSTGGYYGRSSWGYGIGYNSVILEEDVLWLVLDFQERESRRQVWMGAKRLPSLAPLTPQARRRVSEEAVQALLVAYPPPAPATSDPAPK